MGAVSPEQIERVRATVARLDGDGERLGDAFLGRLGATRPPALRLFPNGAGSLEVAGPLGEPGRTTGEIGKLARQRGGGRGLEVRRIAVVPAAVQAPDVAHDELGLVVDRL